jgi:putative ABC transport system permease protein
MRELTLDMAADAPDTFLLDLQADQLDPLRGALQSQFAPALPSLRVFPVLRARVTGVSGRAIKLDDYQDVRGRGSLGREYTVTYRFGLERNETLVEGKLWDKTPSASAEVSIDSSLRDRYKIALGDSMRFDVLGRSISARVTSVRRVNWSDLRAGGFMFVFRPGVLDKAPHGYVGFLRGPAQQAARARLHAALVSQFPNLSVIDGREVLATARRIIDGVALAVSTVGMLVVCSGLLILLGAVAMTRYRRLVDVAIFKTLGATRRMVVASLLLEYGMLGTLAGAIGSLGAMGLTFCISHFVLDLHWQPLPWLSGAGIGLCALLVGSVGVVGSWGALRRKPLSTLRAE